MTTDDVSVSSRIVPFHRRRFQPLTHVNLFRGAKGNSKARGRLKMRIGIGPVTWPGLWETFPARAGVMVLPGSFEVQT